ncbi:MAG: hypothetical protein ABGZ17_27030 [Planctomycetaceae bacterium]|jgi:hypothetical protein
MATQEQIDSFHRFATDQLENGGRNKTIDEIYDQWRIENQSPQEFEENVAAIQGAIDDMNGGDMGRDADEVIADARHRYKLPTPE